MQVDLNTLEPSARRLAEAAAVVGRPIPLDVAAALIGETPEEALDVAEQLIGHGVLEAAGEGFVGGSTGLHPDELDSVRTAYLYRELAKAYIAAGYGERTPRLLGEYLLKGGDAEAAVIHIDAAATGGSSVDMIELVEAGVAAIEAEGIDEPGVEGRLRLERAKYHQVAGASDLAVEDLRASIRLLDGAMLVDALGFMAAVEDDRQESQVAEVYAAAGIAEATVIGEPVKAGSLLLLHARILNRIGFPAEADSSLARGVGILEEHGNRYQRFLATLNMARIALDRGRAVRAEPLFQQVFTTSEDVGGRAALADAGAWLARAQFMRGHPDLGLTSVATAIELAELEEIDGPIFLAHMAHAEGASRFAAYPEALEAADAMLEQVLLQLPDWENAARYLRARALLGMGHLDDAAAEVERALAATPRGINGWRWRLRIEALSLAVLAARGTRWPRARAEDLTDELLQGLSLDIAAELMSVRADVEGDADLARQSAALAMQLGIPTTAAAAIEAGGLWPDPAAAAVALHIKDTARRVPAHWWEAWSAQPGIVAALETPELVDKELVAANAALQEDLDAALTAAGLSEGATALSPAQRRQQGLVRRARTRRRFPGWLLVLTAGAVVAAGAAGAAVSAKTPARRRNLPGAGPGERGR
jgi:tetratricopeptide (TPR) repeat protein